MSTAAQIEANRQNAQSSTGPVTTVGKEISSQNRRTHGFTGRFILLESESQEDYQILVQSLRDEYNPQTITEAQYVSQLAQHMWLRDRAMNLISYECCQPEFGNITDGQEKRFALYLRYQTSAERSIDRCVNQLLKLRKERRQAEIGFESQKAKLAAEEAKTRLNHARAQAAEIENGVRSMMTAPLPDGTTLSPAALKPNFRLTAEDTRDLANAQKLQAA